MTMSSSGDLVLPEFTTRPVIAGTKGIVAAGHYLAAAIGMQVLELGGNAIDAGVAAGFALSVVKPHECGIGGEAPILISSASTSAGSRVPISISGQGGAPGALSLTRLRAMGMDSIPGDGLVAACVPAAFGAWATALRNYGTMGLAETLGPAVDLARDGFPMYPRLQAIIAQYADRFREEWPSTADIYLDGDRVPDNGWLVHVPDWADAFAQIIDVERRARIHGREAAIDAAIESFYRGPIAERLASFASSTKVRDAMGVHRGLLAADDLARHRTRVEPARSVCYRGIDVYKCDSWTQGPVFLQQLNLLEGFDLAAMGHNSPDYIHTVLEAAKLAFADRETYYGDPNFAEVPMAGLLSKEYARARRGLIDPLQASASLRPGEDIAPGPVERREADGGYAGDTTHLDVIDADGAMISATTSGGWIPTSPVVPGLGFPLGTRAQQFLFVEGHPNVLRPGKRPRTTLTPGLALRAGQPYLAFGSPGGDMQDQVSLEVFLNIVEFGMDLQMAVDAPLFRSEHFPDSFYPHDAHPRRVAVESRIALSTLTQLRSRGHEIVVEGEWTMSEATVARFTAETGLIEGAASPRRMSAYVVGR